MALFCTKTELVFRELSGYLRLFSGNLWGFWCFLGFSVLVFREFLGFSVLVFREFSKGFLRLFSGSSWGFLHLFSGSSQRVFFTCFREFSEDYLHLFSGSSQRVLREFSEGLLHLFSGSSQRVICICFHGVLRGFSGSSQRVFREFSEGFLHLFSGSSQRVFCTYCQRVLRGFFVLVFREFSEGFLRYRKAVQLLASLDVLMSLAQLARQDGYCRWVTHLRACYEYNYVSTGMDTCRNRDTGVYILFRPLSFLVELIFHSPVGKLV